MSAVIPSDKWAMLEQRVVEKALPKGLDAIWDRTIGLAARSVPRRRKYLHRAEKVLLLEEKFSSMGDSELTQATTMVRESFRLKRDTPDDCINAFAMVREMAFRELGFRAYRVQVAGALALFDGCIAEMATGEGKTLTAALTATVIGWRGRGCHVVTVNDYLAKRDAGWMGKLYRACGVSAAYLEQGMSPDQRRQAYRADITYGTNKEVAADFLRDSLLLGKRRGLAQVLLEQMGRNPKRVVDGLVQRGLEFVIVDEADSVLIDEAVTPLIISGEAPDSGVTESFLQAARVAERLDSTTDYTITRRYREVQLTKVGRERLTQVAAEFGGVWMGKRRAEEMVTRALTASEFYRRNHHYIVDEGKVVIVDEFTGRIMPDRQWRDGLHQAVEAKEKVEVTQPKMTLARISFQRFFRLYRRRSGMTGTGREATAEFWKIYGLPVVIVPTNRPCVRNEKPDLVFTKKDAKWAHIVSEVIATHSTGRPVLIGTTSVKDSEYLGELFEEEGLEFRVLNAVRHAEEAKIISHAGELGCITIATNMAGRGTDIELGPGVTELGGLHVIAAERNESLRIDRQLFGRSARQGNPGSAQAIVSLEDNYIARYGGPFLWALKKRHGSADRNVKSAVTTTAFRWSQFEAARLALRQRVSVMKSDHWLDEHLSFAGKE